MKKAYATSLLLNAVLVAVLLVQARSSHRSPAATSNVVPSTPAQAHPAGRRPNAVTAPGRIGRGWRSWIEPLRAAAVPADVLAELVRADFDRRWQARQAELQHRYLRGEIDSDALAAAGIEHDAAVERELEEALGPDAYRTWNMPRVLEGLHIARAGLSETERGVVYDLECALRERLREAQLEKLRGTIDQATLTAREQLAQDEANAQLRALLGIDRADRLQENDNTLDVVKRTTEGMALSDGQIAALADAQRRWDQTRSDLVDREVTTGDRSLEAVIEAQQQAWQRQVDAVLGPGGYERYAKAQDSRFAELSRNAGRWGVASEDVDRVFSTIKNFEDAVHDYSHDAGVRGVDPTIRDAAIQKLAEETERSLQAQLGERSYDALKRNGVTTVAAP